MKKIILSIICLTFVTLFPLSAQQHGGEWNQDDYINVVTICQNMQPLVRTATLYQIATEQSVEQADRIWIDAIKRGICISTPNRFLVKLLVRQKVYKELFKVEGYHGELWSAETVLPNGDMIEVYVGIMSKDHSSSKGAGFMPDADPIPSPSV